MKAELLRFKESSVGCPGIFMIDGELLWLTYEPDSKDPERFQIPYGLHICHRVKSVSFGWTFEVIVEGHTYVYFHWGNKEEDTTMCILLGLMKASDGVGQSRIAHRQFMKRMKGIDEFILEVKKWTGDC